jgi:hypothetical protein
MPNILTKFLSRAKSSLMEEHCDRVNMFLIILALILFILFIVAVCQAKKRNCTRINLGLENFIL